MSSVSSLLVLAAVMTMWTLLEATVFAAKQEAAADFGRGRDDGEKHAGQVEVPEVAGDLHPVVEEGDDGDGEVEGTAYVVSLNVLEVR